MMDGLRNYWTGLSRREQILLMVAGGLAALLLAWLIVRPVAAWQADLRQSHREAVEREGRIAAKADLLSATAQRSQGAAQDAGGALDVWLAGSASEMGLSLSRQEARGPDGARIAIAAAKAPAVMKWLADLERQGLVLDQLTLTPQVDGSLALGVDVRRVRP